MHLAELSWTDADAAEPDVVVLPVGSTEQHGPHAPLGTDVITAEAVAEAGVRAGTAEVLVGPTIPVGVAAEHRQFTGTCWVSPDTFRAYVRETLESLTGHGWDRLVVVNGHGGNSPALAEVCAGITRSESALAVSFTWFDAVDIASVVADLDGVDGEGVVMGHGGAAETSLLRHLRPDLVAEERLADASADAAPRWGEWVAGTNLAVDTAEFSANGAVGTPAASEPTIGEALLRAAAERLAELLSTLAGRDATRPRHK